MTRIESEIHDLYEFLVLNDGMADHDTYHTIVGIANDVAEVEAENAKLRELVREYAEVSNHLCTQLGGCSQGYAYCKYEKTMDSQCKLGKLNDMAREIGIEVTDE